MLLLRSSLPFMDPSRGFLPIMMMNECWVPVIMMHFHFYACSLCFIWMHGRKAFPPL
ncbi:hypothetical protein ERO13_A08G191000v2 [Gossypium hirsutum]|uniref:Uncharacterized protein n=2 Tax=Gossypium TaxID=3633 RepID=A0A5D2YBC2_GOSMU|nr:hypothetical protein ERO13_A08G191000v2 [Gossypium hirsutum]TYH07302.1 hypothetical protein ES288_A08G223400v1 [Gossypium darwinii]TYJ23677.1 hypothetical protein E1A91_A08G209100v1 [Gossypium mustelinum]